MSSSATMWKTAFLLMTAITSIMVTSSYTVGLLSSEVESGTLTISTTPVAGEVFVNGESWGMAPQMRVLPVGTYTVSFGDVSGYIAPHAQLTAVTAIGVNVVRMYTEIPSGEDNTDDGGIRSSDDDGKDAVERDPLIDLGDFSYADGPLPSIWEQSVPDGSIYVANGQVVLNPTGWSRATCIIADDQYLTLDDYAIEVSVTSPGAPLGEHAEIGVVVRWTGDGDCYVITHENNYMRLAKYVNSQFSSTLFHTNTLTAGTHAIRVEVVGSSIKAWLDGALRVDVTDNAQTHGKFGFTTFNCDASFNSLIIEPKGG